MPQLSLQQYSSQLLFAARRARMNVGFACGSEAARKRPKGGNEEAGAQEEARPDQIDQSGVAQACWVQTPSSGAQMPQLALQQYSLAPQVPLPHGSPVVCEGTHEQLC